MGHDCEAFQTLAAETISGILFMVFNFLNTILIVKIQKITVIIDFCKNHI